MSPQGHPSPDLLQRFVRGEASLAERKTVVRHLLSECGVCAKAIWPVWGWPIEVRH